MQNPLINTPDGKVFAPGLKNRGLKQRARTHQGVTSGSINAEELEQLRSMRSDARGQLNEAKSNNGWVGPRERLALHQDLNQISQTIFKFKHN